MIDINELRRLAQAATPGPWYVTGNLTRYVEARIDGGLIQEVAACGPTEADGGYGPQQEANARLIAAANPAAISELLDHLEEAENDAAHQKALAESALRVAKGWEDKCNELRTKIETAEKERDALRGKVAHMEKRLRLILEEPENTMSNSKALREMVRQARLALEKSK